MQTSAKARIALVLFLLCALSACGNKGPLVMPDPKPIEAPVAPAEQPATETPAASGTPGRR